MAYYAIARGLNTGIFSNSNDFNKYKVGKFSCGRKCNSKEEAEQYLKDINMALKDEYYAFVDLEFTCANKLKDFKNVKHIGEVLSIGLIITNAFGQEQERFYSTVKPKYNYKLTDFCKDLTHLTQEEIDNSSNLMNVLESAHKLIKKYNINRIYCFGTTDYLQTKKDIEGYKGHALYKRNMKFINKFYNCQNDISKRIIQIQKSISLSDCKKILRLDGEVIHNALADAIDLSNIYFNSIYNPPSKKIIKEYQREREEHIKYKQLRRIHSDEKIQCSKNEQEKIREVCDILKNTNYNIDEIKLQTIVDDLLELIADN